MFRAKCTNEVVLMLTFLSVARLSCLAETNYFLVNPLPGTRLESFIIPLSKPEDIAHAREQIAKGSETQELNRPIVGVKVLGGRDGINRNYSDPTLPQWSWHVSEFLEFADGAADAVATYPSYLEINFDWAHRTNTDDAVIAGFLGHRVARELGPVPLFLSALSRQTGLEFYWSTPGTNYLYTLEAKKSLTDTIWLPVSDRVRTNFWLVLPCSNQNQIYRVRAELSP